MGHNRSRCSRQSSKKSKRVSPSLLERIQPNAAGIDCGSEQHHVAVPSDRDPEPVRSFKTFTADLHRLADWLQACGIETVAMESTGVYWIPIYEILEERGFEVVLVNARHVKNVPGRKSDVLDCQWIQELHSVGLLSGSFRPTAEITSLRTYLRHREKLIQGACSHIQRMQKALVQMNLQLHNVISDITGVTGMRILRDIVAGITDPTVLAAHRDHRCRASQEEITASLTGNYRAEHLFALRQNLELYDTEVAPVWWTGYRFRRRPSIPFLRRRRGAALVASQAAHRAAEDAGNIVLIRPALLDETDHGMRLGHAVAHGVLSEDDPRDDHESVLVLGSYQAAVIDDDRVLARSGLREEPVLMLWSRHERELGRGRLWKKADRFGSAPP